MNVKLNWTVAAYEAFTVKLSLGNTDDWPFTSHAYSDQPALTWKVSEHRLVCLHQNEVDRM